jgi:hypothetical protein
MPAMANELISTWSADWEGLGSDQDSADRVIAGIDKARAQTLQVLQSLD